METVAAKKRGRPAKGRDPDTRALLVRRGVELLTEQGWFATGIDEVLSSVGVPKGSFYHWFESKEAFGSAVLDAYGEYHAKKLDRWLGDTSIAPLDRIAAFVNDAGAGMRKYDFARGCVVGNLGQEVNILPVAFRERLLAILADWQRRVARCLRAAQAAGEIAKEEKPAELAAFFWTGWEGAVLRAKMERSEAPLRLFFEGFRRLVARRAV